MILFSFTTFIKKQKKTKSDTLSVFLEDETIKAFNKVTLKQSSPL